MTLETVPKPEEMASERAYEILSAAYDISAPHMEKECSSQGVPMPTCRSVNSVLVETDEKGGYCDAEKGLLTLSAKEIDKALKQGFPEPFVLYLAISMWFHELKHYKDFKEATPTQREEMKRRYAEDPLYRKDIEKKTGEYGIMWAKKVPL